MAVYASGGFDPIQPVDIASVMARAQQMKSANLENAYRQLQINEATEDAARKKEVRTGLAGAYDATTGAVDPDKARAAYVKAGDYAGLDTFNTHYREQDEQKRKDYQNRAAVLGQSLFALRDVPMAQRSAWIQGQKQGLIAQGVDAATIDAFAQDPSDTRINQALANTMSISEQMKLHEADQGKYLPVAPGGRLVLAPGSARGTAAASSPSVPMPSVGAVEDGYRFKGGDPSSQSSWEPVSASAIPAVAAPTTDDPSRYTPQQLDQIRASLKSAAAIDAFDRWRAGGSSMPMGTPFQAGR